MELNFYLEDLYGSSPISDTFEFLDGALRPTDDEASVTIALNDARTATVSVSLFDDVVVAVKPLSMVLRVTYGPALAFRGTVGRPVAKGKTGTMDIPARDQVRRLERRNLRYGHSSVDDGYPRNGDGVRQIISDAEPNAPTHTTGIRLDGPDTATTSSGTSVATRGDEVWSTITDLTQAEDGLDVELIPVDSEHPPSGGAFVPGDMCELATWEFQGVDRTIKPDTPTDPSDYLSLDYGCGNDILEDFEMGPDADALINYYVAVASGGEIDADDSTYRKIAHEFDSELTLGIYERWESVDVGDARTGESTASYEARVADILQTRAVYMVKTYRVAPQQMTLTLPADRDDIPNWGIDFGVGDRIHTAVKKGAYFWEGDVRIIGVKLSRDGQSGGTRQDIQVVPMAGDAVINVGGE